MSIFKFKNFTVNQTSSVQKVGTDAMVLGALVNTENPKTILDVGTGCGVIALMLAQKYPGAHITGIDIDRESIFQTESNFINSNFPNQFEVVHQNFLTYSPVRKVDLIISNPPYFNTQMPSDNEQRSLARHENSMSLRALINHSSEMLTEQGELWIIVPSERTEKLIADGLSLSLKYKIKIYGKPDRHVRDVLVFSKHNNEFKESLKALIIRDDEGQYTAQYKELTISFHYNKL